MFVSTTREPRGSHPHPQSNKMIHLLQKEVQNPLQCQLISNVQHYDHALLVPSMNSYWLIVLRYMPNVRLIPFGNDNDQNKSIPWPSPLYYTIPWAILSPPSVQSLTFQVPWPPLSCMIHPLEKFPCIRRSKNQGISLLKNHHTGHNMLMEINRQYWVPVFHNGPAPKYHHTVVCSNSFCRY